MIFRFFLVAVIIFSLFRFLGFIVRRVKTPFRTEYQATYALPLLELFSWIAYIIWAAKIIYDSKSYFVLIAVATVFALVSIPVFILIRDFITGIFLRLQNKITEGMYLEVDDIRGIVKNVGHLRLDIEDNLGNINSIPYYSIRSKAISRPGNNQNLEKVSIQFDFEETSDVNELIARLKRAVMNTPWVSLSRLPIVEAVKKEDGHLVVDIGAFVMDKLYADNIKAMVMAHFGASNE